MRSTRRRPPRRSCSSAGAPGAAAASTWCRAARRSRSTGGRTPRSRSAEEKQRLLDTLAPFDFPIDVEVLQEGDAAGSSEDDPLARSLAAAIAEVEGTPPRFELCPGLLETRWYAREGIPAYAYGPGRLDLAHGPDEHVEVEALLRAALVYARTIERTL